MKHVLMVVWCVLTLFGICVVVFPGLIDAAKFMLALSGIALWFTLGAWFFHSVTQ